MTLTPEVDPAARYNQLFDTIEVKFTKYSEYGISYAPDTEIVEDKVNLSVRAIEFDFISVPEDHKYSIYTCLFRVVR